MPPRRKRKIGRPSVLDEVVPARDADGKITKQTRRERVLAALRNGARLTTAFGYAGIAYRTGMKIMERGRLAAEVGLQTSFVAFVQDVERERMEAKLRMEQAYYLAGTKEPTAKMAREWLKDNYPDEYGDRLRIEMDVARRETEQLARAAGYSDEEVAAAIAEADRLALEARSG